MAAWLLGKDQSPGAGQASRVRTGRVRQGRSSWNRDLRRRSTPRAARTARGAASAVTEAARPSRRERHQATARRRANRRSPYSVHAFTAVSNQPGACRARSTTSR